MYKKFICIILLLFSLFNFIFINCKKNNAEVKKVKQNTTPLIPGYYDINFNKIFTKKDNYSTNDDSIIYQLNKYYTHI